MSLEINTVRRIQRILESKGATVVKTHGSALSSGQPDLFVTFPFRVGEGMLGLTVVIEVKQKGGKRPTQQQFATLEKHARSGAIAFWTNDPDEVSMIIAREVKVRLEGKGLTTLRNFRPIPPIYKKAETNEEIPASDVPVGSSDAE